MLRSLGIEQDWLVAEENVLFVVRSMSIDYLKSARFNEQIDVSTKIIESKKASLVFEQAITREQEVLCTSTVRIACLDAQSMRPKSIPLAIVEQLS